MATPLDNLEAAVAKSFGYLGVSGIQLGSTFIPATPPPTLAECVGAGDTIRVGDVVIDLRDGKRAYPHRIEAIFITEEKGLGPSILSREIDRKGSTSYLAWGAGWCREFKVLNQADVDAWFAKVKALRSDGWHKLPDSLGRVLILGGLGIPVEIERRSTRQPLKMVVAAVEQMLGFDITPCRTYSNESKLNVKVKRVVRRQPPKV